MAIKTIIFKGNDLVMRKEAIADAAITPGNLLELTATGVKKHAGAGLNAQKMFAVENEVVGDGIGDDYATSDTCLYAVCPPGTEVFAIAGTAGVTALKYVESDGLGRLDDATVDVATDDTQRNSIVGLALTAATVGNRFQLEVA